MNQGNGRVQALLGRVEDSRRERRERTLEEGRQRADELVARARGETRARTVSTARDERERQNRRLGAARAELLTRTRQLEQNLAAKLLGRGWERLRIELCERWRTPAGRARWGQALIARAAEVLTPGRWTLEHPAGVPEAELDALASRIGEVAGEPPVLEAKAELEAGLRIVADSATLDGSVEGLLSDKASVEGRLLVELGRGIDHQGSGGSSP